MFNHREYCELIYSYELGEDKQNEFLNGGLELDFSKIEDSEAKKLIILLESIKDKMGEDRDNFLEMERHKIDAESENDSIEDEVAVLESEVTKLTAEVGCLKEELIDLEENYRAVSVERNELFREITQLKMTLTSEVKNDFNK